MQKPREKFGEHVFGACLLDVLNLLKADDCLIACNVHVETVANMKESLTITEIKHILSEKKSYIEQQYHVKEIGVFGSYAQGRQTKRSDVDILVDFHKTISAFAYIRLKTELATLLGRKVDLVAKQALKPHIGKRILNEVIYL